MLIRTSQMRGEGGEGEEEGEGMENGKQSGLGVFGLGRYLRAASAFSLS